MGHGSRKKPFDFGGNPDHGNVRVRVGVTVRRGRAIPSRHVFNSNNFSESLALAGGMRSTECLLVVNIIGSLKRGCG